MRELKHLRNNKEQVDYIIIKDITLKNEEYKKLRSIKYKEGVSLEEYINGLVKDIEYLKEQIKEQDKLIQKQNDLLTSIERGLNLR